jgi:hypothetical protein
MDYANMNVGQVKITLESRGCKSGEIKNRFPLGRYGDNIKTADQCHQANTSFVAHLLIPLSGTFSRLSLTRSTGVERMRKWFIIRINGPFSTFATPIATILKIMAGIGNLKNSDNIGPLLSGNNGGSRVCS